MGQGITVIDITAPDDTIELIGAPDDTIEEAVILDVNTIAMVAPSAASDGVVNDFTDFAKHFIYDNSATQSREHNSGYGKITPGNYATASISPPPSL